MTNERSEAQEPIHTDHVRDDGTVDDTPVETFYQPLEYLDVGGEESNRYLRRGERSFLDDRNYFLQQAESSIKD